MASVEYLAVTHLPGGGPVALSERAGNVLVYISEQHDAATIVAGLNALSGCELVTQIRHASALSRMLQYD